ncbi:uncharacterized protein LOC134222567 [Armigeres subalbatus]|uniref:uncharacterized protein LOC134222567 n=1 Tax=Armigeres subalbatus TaxID=124917 RepID=UPI002ED4B146
MQSTNKLTLIAFVQILIIKSGSLQIPNRSTIWNALAREDTTDLIYSTEPPCDGSRPVRCIGCRTMKICVGLPEPDYPTKLCPTDTPYCNSQIGACSTVPDDSLAVCSSTDSPTTTAASFYCTGKGFYPDPYSCSSYYYCEAEGVLGDQYQCAPGYTYNSRSQLCNRRPGSCEVLSCTQNDSIFKVYPPNPKYFYHCQYDADHVAIESQILMIACDDGASFDQALGRCVFRCPSAGLFAKSSNANMYYQCYRADRRLVYVEQSCPIPVQVYDDGRKVCVTRESFSASDGKN